jgi:hypothetical protein
LLNLIAFDKEYDHEHLESSFNAIQHKGALEIVTDEPEQKAITRKLIAVLTIPHHAGFSIQNLFRFSLPNGQFYIAQCLVDFGYPVNSKLMQSPNREYHFRVVGFANLSVDLGNTLLRRETKTDKLVGRLFGNNIGFKETDQFNDKYYLVSDNKEVVIQSFDKNFVNTITKYDDVYLLTKGKEMYLHFEATIEDDHTRIIEDIFSNCNFLGRD